ncbi:MAG: hypothetical protein C0407_01165, partial [Desulfobacca sp.]|nr:hypothetical protein [Desulfobacca sp.]
MGGMIMIKVGRLKKLIFWIIAGFLAPAMADIAWAEEPSTDPILRIETGLHTAVIRRIGVDRENRFLVTASEDKTIRVWNLDTGQPIRIIRPPIGDGIEGKLYAVAISPDGNTIACGGYTGWDWERRCSIYLFDRATGILKKRLSGLPNVVHHLAFSPDSKNLVACLSGGTGISVYRTDTWQEEAQDREYGDNSFGATFDQKGRLVTSSLDGYIRLYDSSFRLIVKSKIPGGERPCAVTFSPDGKRIAVGFLDSTKVNILSGGNLSFVFAPDTKGVDNVDLRSVSFSSDGNFLYAGGRWRKNNGFPLRKWSDGGRGSFRDIITGVDNTIMHILPLKNGSMVYGSHDPAFGVITTDDRIRAVITPSVADYRDNFKGFLLSPDSMTIGFSFEVFGRSPAIFSIPSRLLDLEPKTPNSELKPPVTEASGLTITGWKYTETPKLNGQALKLKSYEISRCLAIAPGGKTFLLGTDWYLRLFDQAGKQQWQVSVPGAAWAVNISGNGKLAVAAFGDGTIRWYRMTDGRELLAFFPHKDKKRWILWTPKGYYDCSPNGEDFIGWHINNGKNQAADFFPVSKFRSVYYRPDVMAKVLETSNEEEALSLANQEDGREKLDIPLQKMLPPVVNILSPQGGDSVTSTEITLSFSIRTPSGKPVTRVRVLVDGRPLARGVGIISVQKDQGIRTTKVTIPEKDTEISIIAENDYATSEPKTVSLKWSGKIQEEAFTIKPKLYVLAIGVSKYEDKNLILGFAAKDAKDFAESLLKQRGGLYRDVVLKVLTDQMATKEEIIDGFDWISKETTSKDIAMVFLAGHGVNDKG